MRNRILFAAVALAAVAIWGCTKPASQPAASSSGSPDTSTELASVDEPTTPAAPVSTVSSNTTQADDHAGHDHDGHDHAGHDHGPAAKTTLVSLVYCGDCGHSFGKESKHTCDADHAKCEACGLHKGSELCCKIEGDFAGKKLCGKCGEIGGSEACCKEGAEVCAKCSLHKGSPLCCKLGEKAAAPAEEAPAEAPAAEAAPAAEKAPAEAAPATEAAPAKEGEG